ncbi:hypothetical protein CAOG_05704 [Capsaspora owczarzaki ATCC 30864]|uniref:hypothetical protein n=1 Tax=Capsaspora owczarzaki (strain ATCC 30864) TaxID=595528 RepID=UPI0001FE5985|nr:hypothetical protein CAOG_05704 [Capsaspora owczarzaki ATCC 30864]|eukprot:XP_004346377.1 hypothetical protein CAOG_05704 [Capsaspora owczarzaki ATCC 30864]
MVYHPVKLNLTRDHVRKLAKGKNIRLSNNHIKTGGQTVHLTKTQINRIGKARKTGSGITLQLSLPQLRHHGRHGAGFFGNLLKGVAKNVINTAGKTLLDKGTQKLADYGAKKGGIIGTLANAGASTLSKVGDHVIDKVNTKLGGSGLTKAGWKSACSRAKASAKKGGSFNTHLKRELNKEIKKKTAKRKSAGSKRPARGGQGFLGNILGSILPF